MGDHDNTGVQLDFGLDDCAAQDVIRRNPSTKKGKKHNDCVHKFAAIMRDLKGDADAITEFYQTMCQFQDRRGRENVRTQPGAPEYDRTRGRADKPKGTSKPKNKASHSHGKSKPKSSGHNIITGISKKKVSRTEYEFYEGDAAQLYLQKHGARTGWVLECYNDTNTDRWFMTVQDGSTIKDAEGNILIKSCVWMMANSITERDAEYRKPYTCDVDIVKACGTPNFFQNVASTLKTSAASQPTPPKQIAPLTPLTAPLIASHNKIPAKSPPTKWDKVRVGWTRPGSQVLTPGSEYFALKKKALSVENVSFAVLRGAMKAALVPDIDQAKNKNDLINLMCMYNCAFTEQPHPAIFLAHTAVADDSSSDSDAPISRGAIRLAKAAAAAAADHSLPAKRTHPK
jgi:hypothetical protein